MRWELILEWTLLASHKMFYKHLFLWISTWRIVTQPNNLLKQQFCFYSELATAVWMWNCLIYPLCGHHKHSTGDLISATTLHVNIRFTRLRNGSIITSVSVSVLCTYQRWLCIYLQYCGGILYCTVYITLVFPEALANFSYYILSLQRHGQVHWLLQ